jgi:hypothetical protein
MPAAAARILVTVIGLAFTLLGAAMMAGAIPPPH